MKHKSIQLINQIHLDVVQSTNYQKNINAYGEHSDTCLICGKRVKDITKSKLVHLLTNGNLISTDEAHEDSQGFYSVGSDCAKKLIISFSF